MRKSFQKGYEALGKDILRFVGAKSVLRFQHPKVLLRALSAWTPVCRGVAGRVGGRTNILKGGLKELEGKLQKGEP